MTAAIAMRGSWPGFRVARNPAGFDSDAGEVSLQPFKRGQASPFCAVYRNARVVSVLRLLVVSFLALVFSYQACAAAAVGMITKVENQAQVGGQTAVVGTLVQMNDELRTGPKSRLEVSFRDKTTLTLGENARVVVDRFVFSPDDSTGALVLSTSSAAFRMVTGRIGEMQNKDIRVSTPFAALAVRGTDYWWGPTEGHYGALLVSNSRVDVRNDKNGKCDDKNDNNLKDGNDKDRERCRCAVTLDRAGKGTDIEQGCPGVPYFWPADKVAAALSTTQFGLASLGSGLAPAAAGAAAAAGAFGASTANNNNDKPPPKVDDFAPPPNNGGGGGNP